jgi:DNA-binding NarL/FixJ family response regulator
MEPIELNPFSRTILEAIAEGLSYDQIVFAGLATTHQDIFLAVREALKIIDQVACRDSYAERMDKIRKTHPRAYEPWLPEEDRRLTYLFKAGTSINELAARFQRQPGAIRSRLQKLNLIS